MHEFVQNLVKSAFHETHSAFLKDKCRNLWTTFYQRGTKNSMIVKLLEFSNSYCTKKGSEPSLDFLQTERFQVKVQAIRLAMSCDGSVSIKNCKNGGKSYALRLACAHPKMVLQWQKIFKDVGMEMNIDKDKNTWSGIHGLASGRKGSFQKFAEIGGFLPENVKVTNGKLVGFEKNEVLRKILNSYSPIP